MPKYKLSLEERTPEKERKENLRNILKGLDVKTLMRNGVTNILRQQLFWRDNWANLSTYFKYLQEVRTLIYTTNAIEGFNRQLRKFTKNKGVFPTDDNLLRMLYLAMMDITKKWTGKRREWGQIHSQLEIFFADRYAHLQRV